MNTDHIKQDFINRFGDAYKDFGLPTLMGRIVGLLLATDGPVSLDEMTSTLEVSKGPVSQILRRLRDHNLVKRVWVGGDRKDYYQAVDHIFLQAFTNQAALLNRNLLLAQEFQSRLAGEDDGDLAAMKSKVDEMVDFNEQMQAVLNTFIKNWQRVHQG